MLTEEVMAYAALNDQQVGGTGYQPVPSGYQPDGTGRALENRHSE